MKLLEQLLLNRVHIFGVRSKSWAQCADAILNDLIWLGLSRLRKPPNRVTVPCVLVSLSNVKNIGIFHHKWVISSIPNVLRKSLSKTWNKCRQSMSRHSLSCARSHRLVVRGRHRSWSDFLVGQHCVGVATSIAAVILWTFYCHKALVFFCYLRKKKVGNFFQKR